MSQLVITDGKLYMDGYNLSGNFNDLSLDYNAEMKDVTTFGSGGQRIFKPGLYNASLAGKAFQDFDDSSTPQSIDRTVFEALANATVSILSVARTGNAEDDVALSLKGVTASITPVRGSVGDMMEFDISAQCGGSRLIHGKILGIGTKSVTGNGTAINLGAVTAGHRVYGALHVVGPVSGTSVQVTVNSSTVQAMTSPTARLTFASKSAIGSEWLEAAGPITDTWWRATWTVTAGSFPIFLVVAIH